MRGHELDRTVGGKAVATVQASRDG